MMPTDPSNKPLTHPRQKSTPETALSGPLSLGGIALPPAAAPAPAQPPPGVSTTPTMGALLLALKRRWTIAVPAATAAAILAVVGVYVVMPPKYTVQTRLKLQAQQARPQFAPGFSEPDNDPAVFRASQQAVIKSSAGGTDGIQSPIVRDLLIP